jgi:hypothetical protein
MKAININAHEPLIYQEAQLELDIFGTYEPVKTAKIIPFKQHIEWSDSAITSLREGLLWSSLRALADGRAGKTTKEESMAWLLSDEIEPFSFVVCCSELGYSPEKIREQTLFILKRLNPRK